MLAGIVLVTAINAVVLQIRRRGPRSQRLAVRSGCSGTRDDEAAGVLAHSKDDAVSPYRVQSPPPPDPYLVAWADLRRRRTMVRALSFLPLILFVVTYCSGPQGHRVAPCLFMTAMALLLIANLCWGFFLCPNCGKHLQATHLNPLRQAAWRLNRATHCGHCGIRVGTPAPDPFVARSRIDAGIKARVDAGADSADVPTGGDTGDAADAADVSREATSRSALAP
jgi:hypothetical protein